MRLEARPHARWQDGLRLGAAAAAAVLAIAAVLVAAAGAPVGWWPGPLPAGLRSTRARRCEAGCWLRRRWGRCSAGCTPC